ncbi:hypothetical protein [Nocardia goodfellowii]|uniref:Uncharacterized protein n=1 Tax=Nocardia goodfellowii TaxID=882446 RepID=A0ABS4QPG7_9NOCA|nr:hypothetical protein [Nocardia goodfellowii]MBP2193606.1 hypothetical protein [Nocardia goodfellowii]
MASAAKSPTATDDDPVLPRPLKQLPPHPERARIRAVRVAAEKHLGMSQLAATAMASIWVDPDDVLRQIEHPRKMRIPGGVLLCIESDAWTARLMPDPTNPRNGASYVYPAAGTTRDAADLRVADKLESAKAEMIRTTTSVKELIRVLTNAMAKTAEANDLYPPIAEQGIMDAPFGVMEVIDFEDGSEPIAVPCVREGSSRVSHAHRSLGVGPKDTLQTYVRSSTELKRTIWEINSLVTGPVKALTDEDRARIRCTVAPFMLIVGFRADVSGEVDLGEAIKAKVAQEHLNTKLDWTESAKNSALADDCLRAVRGLLDGEDEYRWLSGRLDRAEAVARGVERYPDDRFARLIYLFTTTEPKVHKAIRRPIAFVLRKEKPPGRSPVIRRRTKIPVAVELLVRELRTRVDSQDPVIERIEKVLVSGAQLTTSGEGIGLRGQQSLEALAEEARSEAETGAVGPAGRELAMRALYYLALHDVIGMPRNDLGPRSDRRTVSELLDAMLRLPHGVERLKWIIEDGRSPADGQVTGVPFLRDSQGNYELSAEELPVPLDNQALRYELFPKYNPAGEADEIEDIDPFEAAQLRFGAAVEELESAHAVLSDVSDDDLPTVELMGVAPDRALKWRAALGGVRDSVDGWFATGLQHGKSPNTP